MKSQIRLGKIFGIRIGLHYSWFLIAFLIVFFAVPRLSSKPSSVEQQLGRGSGCCHWLLFFISLLLHETLAFTRGQRQTEFRCARSRCSPLGSVPNGKGSQQRKSGILDYCCWPAHQYLIGLVCLGTVDAVSRGSTLNPFMAILSWLGYINLGLAFFNLIPGYPLDGGRILRAILWWKTGNLERSTGTATRAGQFVAAVFIAFGIVGYFKGGGLSSCGSALLDGFFCKPPARAALKSV